MARARTGAVRACLECGKEIYLSPRELPRRKYCSRACQALAGEKLKRRTCERCGKPFAAVTQSVGKYCSRTCYMASRQKHSKCLVCGAPLQPNELRYCSQACSGIGRSKLETRPCEVCGKPMSVVPHLMATKRVCSTTCNGALKRLKGPGSRNKRSDGYMQVYYPTHPDCPKGGFMLEHRLVAEQKYGRRILRSEHVHHINGIRDDNRPENLEILDAGTHAGVSTRMGVAKRKSMRERLAEYERRFGPLRE